VTHLLSAQRIFQNIIPNNELISYKPHSKVYMISLRESVAT